MATQKPFLKTMPLRKYENRMSSDPSRCCRVHYICVHTDRDVYGCHFFDGNVLSIGTSLWLVTLVTLTRKLMRVEDAFNINRESIISSVGSAFFICENKRRPVNPLNILAPYTSRIIIVQPPPAVTIVVCSTCNSTVRTVVGIVELVV